MDVSEFLAERDVLFGLSEADKPALLQRLAVSVSQSLPDSATRVS